MKVKGLIFLCILCLFISILYGCGSEETPGILDPNQIDQNQLTPVPAVPTRVPLSPEEISSVIDIDKKVVSIVGRSLSFEDQSFLQNLSAQIRAINGVEDVSLASDTFTVLYENGGMRCWMDEKLPISDIIPELPSIEKPPDITAEEEIVDFRDSIESNKVILINSLSDDPSRSNDINYLNSIEGWFKNYLNYNVSRLNGSSVDIESFKSLYPYGIIIYNGKGNLISFQKKNENKEYLTLIQSNKENISLDTDGYWNDWYNYRIVPVNFRYYISNKFFDYYYSSKKFPSSIFYNGASKGTKSGDKQYPLCTSLYNAGVSVCIGWSENQSISMTSAYVLFYSMIYNSSTETVEKAIKSLDSKYTQQKNSYGTAYLGYYPQEGGAVSIRTGTGHTFSEATIVTVPYKAVHMINSSGAYNYYKINITEDSILTGRIIFDSTKGNLDLYLYDSGEKELSASKGTGNEELIVQYLEPGTYYIVVKGVSNSYSISIDCVPAGYSFESALEINLPYSAYHMTSSEGKGNYYRLNLSSVSDLRSQIKFNSSGENLSIYIYDQSKNEIARSDGSDAEKTIILKNLKGIYYILIKGAINKYNISVAVPDETGHTFETAIEVDLPYRADHSIVAPYVDNFYKINLQPGGSIESSISFLQSNGDLDLYLYDSSKKLLEKSEGQENEETVAGKDDNRECFLNASMLKSGIYYIKVHGYFGSLNRYVITIKRASLAILSLITDSDGDNKDSNNSYSSVYFTLTGENFRHTRASAKGKVTFIDVTDNSEITANISSWSDSEIKGSVVIPGGKYWVHVTVRGYVTTDEVFYFKGIGDVGF